MIARNERPHTAENGEGPESAATVNRCNDNFTTTNLSEHDRGSMSARDDVGEGATERNAHPVVEPVSEDTGVHRSQNNLSALRCGAAVRLDLLHAQRFGVVNIEGNSVWLRHAHGWILKVPKWRVIVG